MCGVPLFSYSTMVSVVFCVEFSGFLLNRMRANRGKFRRNAIGRNRGDNKCSCYLERFSVSIPCVCVKPQKKATWLRVNVTRLYTCAAFWVQFNFCLPLFGTTGNVAIAYRYRQSSGSARIDEIYKFLSKKIFIFIPMGFHCRSISIFRPWLRERAREKECIDNLEIKI